MIRPFSESGPTEVEIAAANRPLRDVTNDAPASDVTSAVENAVASRLPGADRWPLGPRFVENLRRNWRLRYLLSHAASLPSEAAVPEAAAENPLPLRPPVFVLTAGWRSGSTAVQRLITSGGSAFVWGEPYATSRLMMRMHRIAVEATEFDGRPPRALRTDEIDPRLSTTWIATTNPECSYLIGAMRAMYTQLYWAPLARTGFQTWGNKEVNLTPGQLDLLLRMFPDASYVCLVRDPVDSYSSFRRSCISGIEPRSRRRHGMLRWIRGPVGFSRVWSDLAAKFRELEGRENVHVFRYEDVAGRASFPDELGARLGMSLDASTWQMQVGRAPAAGRFVEATASAAVRRLTADEARRWGFADGCRERPAPH